MAWLSCSLWLSASAGQGWQRCAVSWRGTMQDGQVRGLDGSVAEVAGSWIAWAHVAICGELQCVGVALPVLQLVQSSVDMMLIGIIVA